MIDCPDDCRPEGDRILRKDQKTARKGHVCDMCGCSGIAPGDRDDTLVVIDEDTGRFAIKRYCLNATACLLESEAAELANAEEMRKATDEFWAAWVDGQCNRCGNTGLLGDDENAVRCPDCREKA